jgi:hypothetical protein
MTDLDAIIQAAEDVRDAMSETPMQADDLTMQLAKAQASLAFAVFVDKLKALRQGIYG